jgi:hypothetical protein
MHRYCRSRIEGRDKQQQQEEEEEEEKKKKCKCQFVFNGSFNKVYNFYFFELKKKRECLGYESGSKVSSGLTRQT